MNREIPSASKLVTYHDFKRNWQIHENKIRKVKPVIESKQRQKIVSIRKSITPSNRMLEIKLENRSLLRKLTERQLNRKTADQSIRLIKNNRKQYYEEYTRRMENEGLLKRIKHTKTSYKMKKYLAQRKGTQRYINLISKFGYKDLKPTKTILKFQMNNDQSKYVDRFKSNESDKQNKRDSSQSPIQCHKIIQIMSIRRETVDNRQIRIKGIEFDNKVIIQITVQRSKNIDKLQISTQLFQTRFNKNLKELLNSVVFKENDNYFCIV